VVSGASLLTHGKPELDTYDAVAEFNRNDQGNLNDNTFQHTESVPYPAYRVKYDVDKIYDIPGVGESYEDCGRIFKIWLCENCGHKQPIKNSCDRAICPECWRTWATKEGKRVVERIKGFIKAYKDCKGKRIGNPKHIIFSPPQEEAKELVSEEGGVDKLRKKAIAIIKGAGIRGGLVIFHPYRIKWEYLEALGAIGKERKVGFWELVRQDALELGNWHEYVNLSPHFHVIGFGNLAKSNEVYDKTGWVYKFKRHIDKEKDVFGLVFYLLSHTAIREGKRAETWFGSLSYNQLSKVKRVVTYDPKICPVCGAEMVVEFVLTGRREEQLVKHITWIYKIPPPPEAQRTL